MSSGFPSKQQSALISNEEIGFQQLELQWLGPIREHTIQCIIPWLESRMEQSDLPSLQNKRLVRVVVELLQNLHHHGYEDADHTRFTIGSSHDKWTVQTENELTTEQRKNLEQRWNALMQLTPEQWRISQREKLASGNRSSHGGGGIGLNEILRKTEGHVEMTFLNLTSNAHIVRFTAQIHPRK